jgi:hypothetical protein
MSGSSKHQKLPMITGEVVLRTPPSALPCPSGKNQHRTEADVPLTVGPQGLPMRPYLCDLCGWWHGTSKGTIKFKSKERGSVRR